MTEPLRVLSLFAGIGGFDLGLERTSGDFTWVVCVSDGCDAEGPAKRNKAEAIAAWNTRSRPPADQVPDIERVRDAILEAMDVTDGLDTEAAETYARAAIAALKASGEE